MKVSGLTRGALNEGCQPSNHRLLQCLQVGRAGLFRGDAFDPPKFDQRPDDKSRYEVRGGGGGEVLRVEPDTKPDAEVLGALAQSTTLPFRLDELRQGGVRARPVHVMLGRACIAACVQSVQELRSPVLDRLVGNERAERFQRADVVVDAAVGYTGFSNQRPDCQRIAAFTVHELQRGLQNGVCRRMDTHTC